MTRLTSPLLILFCTAFSLAAAHPAHAGPDDLDPGDLSAMATALELSKEQQKQVQAIQDTLQKTMAKTRAAIEIASIDLRRELAASSPSEGKVGKLVEEIARLEGQARKARLLAMLKIKKLLNNDQRARLDALQGRLPKVTRRSPPTRAVAPPAPPRPPTPPTGDDFDFDFDFDPDDFDFDIDIDFDDKGLTEAQKREIRRDIERAKRDAQRAKRDAQREARKAMQEARRAQQEARREMERAMAEAQRELERSRRQHTIVHKHNQGKKGPGQVQINSNPPAELYLDGKKIGTTPLVSKMAPGRHVLEARWPDGERKKLTVTVNPGDTVRIVLRQP